MTKQLSQHQAQWSEKFWQSLYQALDIKSNLSTTYHPKTNGQTNQYHDPPPPIKVDGEDHYKVEKILDFHVYWSKVHYLVWWLRYGPENNTWESFDNLGGAADVLQDFHRYFFNKPWDLQSQ
ncbi:hypothetical protein C0995_013632 [Termitomyces sp. Mi166|nr:hypothetical protein C0995_013632 [Termitomyces sp. Mi166\